MSVTRAISDGLGAFAGPYRRLQGEPLAKVAGAVIVLFLLVAAFAPTIAPQDPEAQDFSSAFEGPSADHWLGTDDLGRDTLSRIIFGTRAAFTVSVLAVGIAIAVGTVVGLVSALSRRLLSAATMRTIDVVQAVPALIFALALIAILRPSVRNAGLAIGIIFIPAVARLVNFEAARVARLEFVEASRLSGSSQVTIALRHVLPNIAPALIVQASGYLGVALLVGSGLDFIGFGAQPPTVSWGSMLARAYDFLPRTPAQLIFPGIALAILSLSFSFLGDGLARVYGPAADRPISRKTSQSPGETATERSAPDGEGEVRETGAVQLGSLASVDSIRPPAHPGIVETDDESERAAASEEGRADGLRVDGLMLHTATGGPGEPLVEGLSLHVGPGRIVGLVGESGSGKSLTALSCVGLLPAGVNHAAGEIRLDGARLPIDDRNAMRPFRGRDLGIVFQDPMSALAPFRRVGLQIDDVLRSHSDDGRSQRRARVEELLGLVGVPDPGPVADKYPFQLSGGLRQRALIAYALAGSPRILIADEATTALDAATQAELLQLLIRLRAELSLGILVITHDIAVVEAICDEVVVMYAGRVMETGPVDHVLDSPMHPYTRALLAAMPRHAGTVAELASIPGRIPEPRARPALGCVFSPRCPHAAVECESPVPLEPAGDRQIRCVRHDLYLTPSEVARHVR